MNPNMIHYAGENKPWNTDKVDFMTISWKTSSIRHGKEAYFRQLSLINSSNPAHTAGQTPVLLQTRIKKR